MVLFQLLIVLVGLVIAWSGPTVVRWVRQWYAVYQLPGPPEGLLGADKRIFQHKRHRMVLEWVKHYGGMFGFRFLHINMVVVTDPGLAMEVLSRDGRFDKHRTTYKVFNQMSSTAGHDTIFTSPSNPFWKLVRKGVAPAFNPRNIRQGFHHVLASVDQLSTSLQRAGPRAVVDIDNAIQRESLDIIGRVGFGKDFGSTNGVVPVRHGEGGGLEQQQRSCPTDEHAAFFDLAKACLAQILHDTQVPFFTLLTRLSKTLREHKANYDKIIAVALDLVREVKARGEPAADDMTIAAHLLRIRDPATGAPLPDDVLAGEFLTFFIAGFDTTAHTISWTIYLISQHPEVEAKVEAELEGLGLLAKPGCPAPRRMTYDDTNKLPYTLLVVKESMRLLPIVADGSVREPVQDLVLGGHHLPAGTAVWIPFMAAFNSPHLWQRPDSFEPERWLTENETANGTSGTAAEKAANITSGKAKRFYPFSEGSRDCVGQSLAKMSYTTTLAMLLGRFKFRLAEEMGGPDGVRASEASMVTLHCTKGMLMHALPRVEGASYCRNG